MKIKTRIRSKRRSKLGISVIIGSVLMIAATLAVGYAVWAWAGGTASSTENNYAYYAIGNSVNATNEKISIVNANFSSSDNDDVNVWLYNYGSSTAYVKEIIISNASSTWTYTNEDLSSLINVDCKTSSSCLYSGHFLPISAGSIYSLHLENVAYFTPGSLYQFEIVGLYGTTYTYQQVR